MRYFLALMAVVLSVRCVAAADVASLVDDLADDKKRAVAIAEILKMGPAAESALEQIDLAGKVNERQLTIVRRLLGEIQINRSELKPVDTSHLKPFGIKKDNPGDPTILLDPDEAARARHRTIVLSAEIAHEHGVLEYAVVCKDSPKGQDSPKLHEAIIAIDAVPQDVFVALLVCGYADAGAISEEGVVPLAKDSGVMMSVEFEWETPNAQTGEAADDNLPKPNDKPVPIKRLVRVPIEYFAFNRQTGKCMKRVPFAFTGSKTEKNPRNGRQYFLADLEKTIAALRVDEIAVLNSPLNTSTVNPRHAKGYQINERCIPPQHSPCKLVFEPYDGPELSAADLSDTGEVKSK